VSYLSIIKRLISKDVIQVNNMPDTSLYAQNPAFFASEMFSRCQILDRNAKKIEIFAIFVNCILFLSRLKNEWKNNTGLV